MDSAQSSCDRRKWFIHDDDEAIIIEEKKKKKKSFENESTPRFHPFKKEQEFQKYSHLL